MLHRDTVGVTCSGGMSGQEHVGEAMAAVAIVTIHPSITSVWTENRCPSR